jgi:hypothetical protein
MIWNILTQVLYNQYSDAPWLNLKIMVYFIVDNRLRFSTIAVRNVIYLPKC